MNLKHPNDPAVARRLKAFENELRSGYHFPGSAENVFEQLRWLDDEAEAQHQATLRKAAEEAWKAWNVELAKRRAEKEALFGPRYAPSGVVWCPGPRYHITITPPSQPPPVMTNEERLSMAQQLLRDVMLDTEYLPSGVRGNAEIAQSRVVKAKKALRGDGNA